MVNRFVGTVAKNLGFILQFNGAVTAVPLAFAFLLGESQAFQGLTIATILYLVVGFGLSHAPSGELDLKSISTLVVLTFILTAFVGAIPYLVTFPIENLSQTLVNAVFESVSGYTTTGLTTFTNIEAMPQSILFFRSLTQWVGGVSIVFLLLLFLNIPGKAARDMAYFSGFEKLRPSARNTFIEVLKIYLIYTALFGILFTLLSGLEILDSVNLVLSTVSTGGFSPLDNLDSVMVRPGVFILIGLMIVGAMNFSVPYNAFRKKPQGNPRLEFVVFLVILAISILFVVGTSLRQSNGNSILNLAFLAISAVTTTGLQPLSISSLTEPQKIILIASMFIGGMSFSTAGGIKVFRLLIVYQTFIWSAKKIMAPPEAILPIKIGTSKLLEREIILSFVLIVLAAFTIIVFAFIFTLCGYPFIDSVVEVTSAFATTGLTSGLTTSLMNPILKILLIFEMILGRVEVLPFLVCIRALIFSRSMRI